MVLGRILDRFLQPADARVAGTFADGSPAVLEKRHGKGRVVLFGFLPGQAYLKSGLPLRPVDRGLDRRPCRLETGDSRA